MPQLNLSLQRTEEDHLRKKTPISCPLVVAAAEQTHLEDLAGYRPDLSNKPFNFGPIKHEPAFLCSIMFNI